MSGPTENHPRALSLMKGQASVATLPEFAGTVGFVPTREFWRPAEASPANQAYHWNRNAETYWLIGAGLGQAMLGLDR
jgi:alpha-galactosidase